MMRTVPPGGFAGYAQMTPAGQRMWGTSAGSGGRRRRSKKKAKAGTKRRKKRASKRGGKLKKGSAAAKARMAKLRKMRKK